jgi:acyl transferase domain-containing protein
MAFAAAREARGPGGCELRDVRFANPCFLAPDRPLWAHTSFDVGTSTVQVYTRPITGGDWTGHLTASAWHRPAGEEGARLSPAALRENCPREISRARCYEYLRRIGLNYGPLFQAIASAWQGEFEALGLVRLPEAIEREADNHLFHPALLDGCLQMVIAADSDFDERDTGLYLPSEIDEVRLFGPAGRRVWVHARLLEKTPRRYVAEIDVYAEDGQPVARLRGLRCQRVAGSREESLDDLLYAYQWKELNHRDTEAQSEEIEKEARESGSPGGGWCWGTRADWAGGWLRSCGGTGRSACSP